MRIEVRTPIGAPTVGARTIESYVDGARQREDVTIAYPGDDGYTPPGAKTFTDYHIYDYSAGREIYFSTRQFVDGAKCALSFYDTPRRSESDEPIKLNVCDARWLAWHSEGIGFGVPMREVLGNPRYTNREMRDDTCRGIECKRLSFQLDGDKHLVWVAPQCGYSILAYRLEVAGSPPAQVYQSDIQVRRWKQTDIWVPVSYVYEMLVDGVVAEREETDIEFFSLNEALDDSIFQANSLPVPVGRVMNIPSKPSNETWVWNGSEPVLSERGVESGTIGSSARVRLPLLLVAFVLTVICVACFAGVKRKRSHIS